MNALAPFASFAFLPERAEADAPMASPDFGAIRPQSGWRDELRSAKSPRWTGPLAASLALHALALAALLVWTSGTADAPSPEPISVEIVAAPLVETPPVADTPHAAADTPPPAQPEAPAPVAELPPPPPPVEPPPPVAETTPPEPVELPPPPVVAAPPPPPVEPPPPVAEAPPPAPVEPPPPPVAEAPPQPVEPPPPVAETPPAPPVVQPPPPPAAVATPEPPRLVVPPARLVATPITKATPRPKSTPKPAAAAARAPDPAPASATATPASAPALSAELEGYKAGIYSRIAARTHYPAAALERGPRGVAVVTVTLDREGQIVTIKLARSAGDPALDADALETVRRVAPFGAPPKGAAANLTVTASLNYRP